jgi:hypothetical protein
MYTILDIHGKPVTDKDGNPIEHNGTYADDYAELRKQAPVTIIQHTTLPDEDGTTSYPVHIGTPGQQASGCGKIARYCVIALMAALLTTSCGKTPANGNFAIENLETGMYCEESLSDPSDPLTPPDTVIDLQVEWNACYRLAHAFAVVESNDNPHAVNHRENAVGLLQIRPIMVRQANQIVGEELYELSDREDSLVSLGIFHTVMSELNPELDVDKAIDIWNPNASKDYRNLIKAIYNL